MGTAAMKQKRRQVCLPAFNLWLAVLALLYQRVKHSTARQAGAR
jgi:hypothetical protein